MAAQLRKEYFWVDFLGAMECPWQISRHQPGTFKPTYPEQYDRPLARFDTLRDAEQWIIGRHRYMLFTLRAKRERADYVSDFKMWHLN